ncbi:MAG: ABC transporter permease [Chloroflexi bacterium]|nr:ABC transporter permease [Chloroflexota bacterium]
MTEYRVVTRHAFRNAAIPVVTVIGLSVATLLGGSVIMESIFGLPGLGRLMLEAIREREFEMIQSVVLLVGVFVMLVNLSVDLVYGFLNPQIRYG